MGDKRNQRTEKADMAYQQIQVDVTDRIFTLTLNRPDRLNAWTPVMEGEVLHAIREADADENVRVIVLTGAGRGFCAGADMEMLTGLAGDTQSARDYEEQLASTDPSSLSTIRSDFRKTYSYLPAISKPIIAALNGPTVGLGLVISLYCDIRFASDQAKFGTAFARRGLIAEHGISWLLPRLVGVSNALDLLYSARIIDAAEALNMGLVTRVFPHASFLEEVRKYARELADLASPRSQRVIKRQVYEALFQGLGEAIDVANGEMIQSFLSEDFKEGVTHFLEKRPPRFTGQ
jgi:enoyl-CoA hydratase/carnithine racemase